MAEELSNVFSRLDEIINDENKVVTYKWLSRDVGIHVNVAKKLLYHYAHKQSDEGANLNLCYLVSGIQKLTDGNKVHRFVVVPERNLESIKAKFVTVTSVHVYSIQLGIPKDDVALYGTDASEVIDNEKYQRYSSIQNNNIRVVKKTFKFPDNTSQSLKASTVKKEETSTKPKVNKFFDNFSKSKQPVKRKIDDDNDKSSDNASKIIDIRSEPEYKRANLKDGSKKSKNNVPPASSFFSKQEALPPKKPTESKLSSNNKKPDEKTKEATKQEKQKSRTDEKNKLKKQKGRRRIHVFSSSSSSENSDNSESETDTKETKLKNNTVPEPEGSESEELDVVRNDNDKSSDLHNNESSTDKFTERSNENKKGVYKMVTKTFRDEDGFMVTKKVKEFVEEDDNTASQTVEAPKPAIKSPVKKSVADSIKNKPVLIKKQASLMNFFGKK